MASPVARLPRVPFSVAVEGLALRACTLCSPFSGAAKAAPYGHIVAGGDSPGFNLCGSSKLPNLQASKLPKKPPDCSGGFFCQARSAVPYLALRAALMAAWAAARRAIGTR